MKIIIVEDVVYKVSDKEYKKLSDKYEKIKEQSNDYHKHSQLDE